MVLGTTTVERYIDPTATPCNTIGYRHYGVPMTGTTLADLNVAGQYAITSQT